MKFYSASLCLLFAMSHGLSPTTNLKVKRMTNKPFNIMRKKGSSFPFQTVLKMSGGESKPPASQLENISSNAKSIQPLSPTSLETNAKYTQSLAAGLAVSLAMVPEAIAFSFVAGVSPLVGLWTTVTLGFTAASLGGRAGICSSASGACSIVVAALCAAHSPVHLSACAILAGILQVLGGYLRLGKFIRLVPHPVMLGFVNGLGLVMTKAQLTHFKNPVTGQFLNPLKIAGDSAGAGMYGLTAATMVLVKLLPKFEATKAIPATLGAVTFTTILSLLFKIPATTLSDIAGKSTFSGGLSVLPKVGIPNLPFTLETLKIILPFAITMAAVGTIESLLTMQLLDGIADDGKRGSTSKETMAQGWGNIVSGLTGGIGGCALLGQSIINMQSGGGISRLSGMSMAAFLAIGIVGAAPLIGKIPVAALVGVMLLVCQSTFSWSSLRVLNKIPKLDAFIIALVSFITVRDDLAKAVVCGTIASALGFAWKQSTSISARSNLLDPPVMKRGEENPPWKEYKLSGPLFFASTLQFSSLFDIKSDPEDVIIDFTDSRVYDHSALEAINNLSDRYGAMGKRVRLRHLSGDCTQLLEKVHEGGLPPYEIIQSDPNTDPVYGIATRYS